MIQAMRALALAELRYRFGDPDADMTRIRSGHGQDLAPLLLESAEKVPRVYILREKKERPGVVHMWVEDMDDGKQKRLPFVKATGSQSPALGPVIKRTYSPGKGAGPSRKILKSTLDRFAKMGTGEFPWSDYFQEILEILQGRILFFNGAEHAVGPGGEYDSILHAAVSLIDERKTVFLTVADHQGRLPGERPAYQEYLLHTLAEAKYLTRKTPPCPNGTCPLCDAASVTLYSNAIKGAGINFANMDREGAFPGLDLAQAWKGYGLCLDCADLLYIFKNHLAPRFIGTVAGHKTLLLPALTGDISGRRRFIKAFRAIVRNCESDRITSLEENVLEFIAGQEDSQVSLHILWAKFGQVIEEVAGAVTDILPSRLSLLAAHNRSANRWRHALAPHHPVEDANFKLSLPMVKSLFHRPGGLRAKRANDSARLWELRRMLALSIYHGRSLGDLEPAFWGEWLTTARCYVDDALQSENAYGLIHEGVSRKGGRLSVYRTLAGWMRHVARFVDFLRITEVLPMTDESFVYQPEMQALVPFFASGSGIDSPEKAFAFLLGILYGKLLQVQAARGVNVASNALTWLKRLNLKGPDLPGLYVKTREKLLAYGVEASPDVRALIRDIGVLGTRLGDKITLESVATCYFLLLGQSVMVDVLPKREDNKDDDQGA